MRQIGREKLDLGLRQTKRKRALKVYQIREIERPLCLWEEKSIAAKKYIKLASIWSSMSL